MRLRYTAEAVAHLSSIYNFLVERNPVAARRVITRIREAASRLREFPFIGQKGDDPGTREWVVQGLPYLIVYEVDMLADEIVVVGVFHGAQNRDDVS